MLKISRPLRFMQSFDAFATLATDFLASALPGPILTVGSRLLFWPTLYWNIKLVNRSNLNWYDKVWTSDRGPTVFLGGFPHSKEVLDQLEKDNVRVLVNTTDRPISSVNNDFLARRNFQEIHIPMTDFARPTASQVMEAVQAVDAAVESGQSVLLHCKAGKGRSATVALCWLVLKKGLSPDAAEKIISAARPQVVQGLSKRGVVLDVTSGRL